MSSLSPDHETPGTLVVELPHWAANVRISDNLYRPVTAIGAPKELADAPGRYEIETELAPGVYQVQVALWGQDQSDWASVRPGKTTRIAADHWDQLKAAPTAPLEDWKSDRAAHIEPAETWSRQSTWAAAPGGTARLFVFVRSLDSTINPRFAEGLSLLRDDETVLVDLLTAAKCDQQAGWMAFNADLPPGYYIVRRSRPGVRVRHQPIFLSAGWETQLFMTSRRKPSLRTMVVSMAPFGQGFRHDDQITAATEAVLHALYHEDEIDGVVQSSRLSQLLHGKYKNPWLGILACYALSAWQRSQRFQSSDESDGQGLARAGFREDVLTFLQQTIGDHPDVRALCLRDNEEPEAPFPHPPLMIAGLLRVKRNAMKFAKTVSVGSLTDRVLKHVITNAPWTAWRNLEAGAAGASPAAPTPGASMVVVPALATALPPSAPVFRPVNLGAAGPRGIIAPIQPADFFRDAALIRAAYDLTPGSDLNSLPDRVTLAYDSILSGAKPLDLSQATGMPLARVEDGLERLRSEATTAGTPPAAVATQRMIAASALKEAIGGTQQNTAAAADAAAGAASDTPAVNATELAGHALTIEESVARLQAEASRLSESLSDTKQPRKVGQQTEKLATRLLKSAEKLLAHADFVSITDPDGKLLYGNGAFSQLMSHLSSNNKRRGAKRGWEKVIAARPLGVSKLKTLAPDTKRSWNLQRTALADEADDSTQAYVNILRPEAKRPLASDAMAQIEPLLNEITLHSSFVAYGSEERRRKSLEALDQLSKNLETLASGVSAPGKNDAVG
ncbi:hypothetical protein [Bradyrhizobium sp.]|jgi:hypothetical protein|uniref:hypothetical protein n=1 Tax=Bradyrhizobium sp. TaxID=376 RepID=UPI002DF9093D|nr:hypothetical protein [Bradyrhizobium sp.]